MLSICWRVCGNWVSDDATGQPENFCLYYEERKSMKSQYHNRIQRKFGNKLTDAFVSNVGLYCDAFWLCCMESVRIST